MYLSAIGVKKTGLRSNVVTIVANYQKTSVTWVYHIAFSWLCDLPDRREIPVVSCGVNTFLLSEHIFYYNNLNYRLGLLLASSYSLFIISLDSDRNVTYDESISELLKQFVILLWLFEMLLVVNNSPRGHLKGKQNGNNFSFFVGYFSQ